MNDKERKEIGDKAYKLANQMGTQGNYWTMKDFSIDQLKTFLITCDGMGTKFKDEALEELIAKIKEDTCQEVWGSYGGI